MDWECAMVQDTPSSFGVFAVEACVCMAVLHLPGGEGQVPFVHGSIGKGGAQGGGGPEGQGKADPACSGLVKSMNGSRKGHAIRVSRAQCVLLVGCAMVGLVGDDAREVAVARSAGGNAGGFPDHSIVCAIRAVNPQVSGRLATWIWRINRFQTEINPVSFPNKERRSSQLAIASDVAPVQPLRQDFRLEASPERARPGPLKRSPHRSAPKVAEAVTNSLLDVGPGPWTVKCTMERVVLSLHEHGFREDRPVSGSRLLHDG